MSSEGNGGPLNQQIPIVIYQAIGVIPTIKFKSRPRIFGDFWVGPPYAIDI
jgi:hypothetical protein